MIVKVKSREMTALSKSNREDQDWRTRGKQSLGSNGAESWPRGERLSQLPWILLEKDTSLSLCLI